MVKKLLVFFCVLFAALCAEDVDFGIQFNVDQNRSLEAYRQAVDGGDALNLSLRIGHASNQQLSKLNIPEIQQSIRSDPLFDKVLKLIKFTFSHFALFGNDLIAVYRPINALTGQPDRESKRAVKEIVGGIRKDFKEAFEKEGEITWSRVHQPFNQELGKVNGENVIAIDFREPLFFVLLKKNADSGALETILDFQRSLFRSPDVVKARADNAVIFVTPHE